MASTSKPMEPQPVSGQDIRFLALEGASAGYRWASVLTPPIYFMYAVASMGKRPFTVNRLLRASWVGGFGGGLLFGGAGYWRYQNCDEEFIHKRRIQAEYNQNRIKEQDHAVIGGVVGSILTTALFWKRANIVHLILGGAGFGTGLGVLTHYYKEFEVQDSESPTKPPPPYIPRFCFHSSDTIPDSSTDDYEFIPQNKPMISVDQYGNMITHDKHLNENGDALALFLREQSEKLPTIILRCRGQHTENVIGTSNERSSRSEIVKDFDFMIDIGQHLRPLDVHDHVNMDDKDRRRLKNVISSSNLYNITEEYCKSRRQIKEFVFEKAICGWRFDEVEKAIRSTVRACLYRGQVDVSFHFQSPRIYVRPPNFLSWLLSSPWTQPLFYPIFWLYQVITGDKPGREQWIAARAYAMKRWVPVKQSINEDDSLTYASPGQEPIFFRKADGTVTRLTGVRESDWMRMWHPTIVHAVSSNYSSVIPLREVFEGAIPEIIPPAEKSPPLLVPVSSVSSGEEANKNVVPIGSSGQ